MAGVPSGSLGPEHRHDIEREGVCYLLPQWLTAPPTSPADDRQTNNPLLRGKGGADGRARARWAAELRGGERITLCWYCAEE